MISAVKKWGVLLVALAGVGCAGGRSVGVLVQSARDGAAPVPVKGAYVQAVPVAMSPVPLPANFETIGEAGTVGTSGFTDERGVFRFRMGGDRPHEIAVSSPIGAVGEGNWYTWRGHLDARGRLEPMDKVPGITVTTTEPPR